MKKIILSGSFLLTLAGSAFAQNPVNTSSAGRQGLQAVQTKAVNTAAPKFKFKEKDNTHDFGTIPEGPKVTYAFTFTNVGKSPLIISNAQASCGCTSPEYPKEPILPGKTGKIAVTYTTEGHPNDFLKSVYLTSNAENPGGAQRYELYIKGKVTPKK
ncbi:MAG: DUF1573 domain-containing protein [Chitinophagaceae bacterium]|jgi:hypothetical protein